MGPDYFFGQFRETARCRDAQHGDGVCCALAPQLVIIIIIIIIITCTMQILTTVAEKTPGQNFRREIG